MAQNRKRVETRNEDEKQSWMSQRGRGWGAEPSNDRNLETEKKKRRKRKTELGT